MLVIALLKFALLPVHFFDVANTLQRLERTIKGSVDKTERRRLPTQEQVRHEQEDCPKSYKAIGAAVEPTLKKGRKKPPRR